MGGLGVHCSDCTRARAAMARAKWTEVPEAEERGEDRQTGEAEEEKKREERKKNEKRAAKCGLTAEERRARI